LPLTGFLRCLVLWILEPFSRNVFYENISKFSLSPTRAQLEHNEVRPMLLTLLHGVAQFLGVDLVTCQKKGAEPRLLSTLSCTVLHTF